MSKNIVITISRKYGSFGREIGRQLAEYLDIGYYDKEIMNHIAKEMGISSDFFSDENLNKEGMYSLSNGLRFGVTNLSELTMNAAVYDKSKEMIRNIAKNESAVIVGRCADYILKDNPNCISVFISSKPEDCLRRVISEYKVPEKEARKKIQEMDERRARFYEFHTHQKWGNANNFDLVINTSSVSHQDVIHMLACVFDDKLGYISLKGAFVDQYLEHKKIIEKELISKK